MSSRAVGVALPLPVQTSFTYRLPENFAGPERGARVLVPFGPRRVIGVVTAPLDGSAPEGLALKDVLDVLDETPLVPAPLLDLAAWMAEHYLGPPGPGERPRPRSARAAECGRPPGQDRRPSHRRRAGGEDSRRDGGRGSRPPRADSGSSEGPGRPRRRRRSRRLCPVRPARRHREREDRGVFPGRRGRARRRPGRDPPPAGDRPHAAARAGGG